MDKDILREFFLVALPGLEDLVLAELKDWHPSVDAKVTHGGVTAFLPLPAGLILNTVMKTPTRILLRVAAFRCRDFPKLYKKTLAVPWEDLVDTACDLEVHASSRVSRLKIKKRIEDTCLDAWIDHRKERGGKFDLKRKLTLYVRFLNDECTLSLDTSGERLHKRGERELIGEAPLRETIAAALLQNVERNFGDEAGREIEVVDPMMGSGTFLLEALNRDRATERRSFAFENFAVGELESPVLSSARPRIAAVTGFESDAKALAAAQGNLKAAAVEDREIHLLKNDFFAAAPLAETSRARWVFCNPPYGERLQVQEPLKDYYERLFTACERIVRPDRALFILPAKAVKGKFILPYGWKVLEKRPFLNGGLPVVSYLFGRPTRGSTEAK